MTRDDLAALPFAPLDPLAPLRGVEALADGVARTVQMARKLAEVRRRVDLAGLDRMVGLLCAKMLDLPLDQGRRLRPRLAQLQQELDGLDRVLAEPYLPA